MKLLLLGLPLFFFILSAISWGVRKFKEFPFFEIHEVVVEGDAQIDFAELIGTNIFDLNSEEITAKCEDEKMKLVKVRRLFPSRVIVEVEERKPFAILDFQGVYEIDSEGFTLGKTDSKRKGFPVIRILGFSKNPVEQNAAGLWELKSKKVMDVIHLFMENFGPVKEIRLYDDDLVIETDFERSRPQVQGTPQNSSNDKEIHLGPDQWMKRIEKLTHISWRQLDERDIDLRFRNQIIVKR